MNWQTACHGEPFMPSSIPKGVRNGYLWPSKGFNFDLIQDLKFQTHFGKCVCLWKIWVRLIKCNKQHSNHKRGSMLEPHSCMQLFQSEQGERAAICWRACSSIYKRVSEISAGICLGSIMLMLIYIYSYTLHCVLVCKLEK